MTIHDWDENALVDLQAVSDSLHQTGQAMINTDLGLMRIGCTNLRSAIDKLERKLPTPDDQATDALHDSIDDWRSLSQLCMTLGASSTDAEFNQMSTYLHDGEAHRQTAYDRLGLQVS